MAINGRTILITRPTGQNDNIRATLEARGATVLEQPAVNICPPPRPDELKEAVRQLANTPNAWTIFSSVNGVARAIEAAQSLFASLKETFNASGRKIAVVGAATKKAVESYGLSVDVVPENFNAEALVVALDAAIDDYVGLTFFSFRGNRGRDVLARGLKMRGANFRETVAYEANDATTASDDVLFALKDGIVDAAIVTSSRSALALSRIFGEYANNTRWVAISDLTAQTLSELGLKIAAVADEASDDGLVAAIESLFK